MATIPRASAAETPAAATISCPLVGSEVLLSMLPSPPSDIVAVEGYDQSFYPTWKRPP
jgi:hypothetical protein